MSDNTDRNPWQVKRDRYRLCPECGNFVHYSERAAFCILCGARLVEECPVCTEPFLYPTMRYCPACGQVIVRKGEARTPLESGT